MLRNWMRRCSRGSWIAGLALAVVALGCEQPDRSPAGSTAPPERASAAACAAITGTPASSTVAGNKTCAASSPIIQSY